MQNYEQVMKTLARSERGDDRQLAADLVGYLGNEAAPRRKTRDDLKGGSDILPRL